METIIFIVIAFIAGVFQPIQGGVNAELRLKTKSPYLSGAISNLLGALLMILFALFINGKNLEIPKFEPSHWWIWTGGIFSLIIVVSTIILPTKISYTTFFGTFITGQLIMATLIDRFAIFGGDVIEITTKRILGIVFLLVGVYLVKK